MQDSAATAKCYDSVEQLGDFNIDGAPSRVEPKSMLMCGPDFFEVKDVKNPHMAAHVGMVDKKLAIFQWEKLRHTFESLGHPVNIVPAQPNLEDMVFAANQVFAGTNPEGTRICVPAVMKYAGRQAEVPFYTDWFRANGYQIKELEGAGPRFEGHGDAVWHPGKRVIWAAHGFRTDAEALSELAAIFDCPVMRLQLINECYYHLDTCFVALDADTAMFYPPAFDRKAQDLLARGFKTLLPVNQSDAANFACNAVVLGRNVVLQAGSEDISQRLSALGYTVVPVDTSEFIKGGGSAFCLKTMVYSAG